MPMSQEQKYSLQVNAVFLIVLKPVRHRVFAIRFKLQTRLKGLQAYSNGGLHRSNEAIASQALLD